MNRRYVHHFEHSDGSVIGIRSDAVGPDAALLQSLADNHYAYLTTTVNPDL